MKRGSRGKKRQNTSTSENIPTISGFSTTDSKIGNKNSVTSKEMVLPEVQRLMGFGKKLGIDLTGIESEIREKLQIMETRDMI